MILEGPSANVQTPRRVTLALLRTAPKGVYCLIQRGQLGGWNFAFAGLKTGPCIGSASWPP
jgi:hypothetical protein